MTLNSNSYSDDVPPSPVCVGSQCKNKGVQDLSSFVSKEGHPSRSCSHAACCLVLGPLMQFFRKHPGGLGRFTSDWTLKVASPSSRNHTSATSKSGASAQLQMVSITCCAGLHAALPT